MIVNIILAIMIVGSFVGGQQLVRDRLEYCNKMENKMKRDHCLDIERRGG